MTTELTSESTCQSGTPPPTMPVWLLGNPTLEHRGRLAIQLSDHAGPTALRWTKA
eukprot:CAMPEP_0175997674 /NCGR_PEP_ID=MMETSP0108-20121206/56315_1 /TAXON_ID=195067 ORGANISM="Goniomonas pacifica, Strain CCMP1869" /NCGR_SAMPLE_ID=MMETSP0108 /ASSEMBLY_ACC=CAM_ASM_000204 /LENGTH=54 /DNA_ID=CAMNT_0017329927 /DNA_START=49 /DNA_END=209 /DNA_ORIENTATION=-